MTIQLPIQKEEVVKQKRIALTGNHAVALAVKMARAEVIAAYPITPQTPVVEKLAEYVNNGELDAEFIPVESEHSAMSAVIGAQPWGRGLLPRRLHKAWRICTKTCQLPWA